MSTITGSELTDALIIGGAVVAAAPPVTKVSAARAKSDKRFELKLKRETRNSQTYG